MMSLVIGIGVVLVLAILYMIFRIGALVSVMSGPQKPGGSANRINATLLMVFMVAFLALFFWYSVSNFDRYNLPAW
jgi:cytochrome c oxidase subunit II